MSSDASAKCSSSACSRGACLLWLIWLVAFVPLAGLYLWDLQGQRKAIALDGRQAAQDMAHGVAAELDSVLGSARQTLEYLASQEGATALPDNLCEKFASYGQVYRRLFTTILVVRTEGSLVCSWPAQSEQPVSFADRTWFKDAMLSKNWVVSAPMLGRLTGKWLIVIATPVFDAHGARTGVLGLTIELERLQEALSRHTETPGAVASVFGQDDQLLTRLPWLDNAMDRKPLPLPAASPATESQLDTLVGLDSTPRFWAGAALEGAPWRVYAGLPSEPIKAQFTRILWHRVGLVVVLGLLGLVVTYLVGRRLSSGAV
jgi:hypothetical protein